MSSTPDHIIKAITPPGSIKSWLSAARLAVLIASALEGAVVLSRIRRNTEPLQVADEIADALRAARDI